MREDIKAEDWARLAAYIDGEGTIQIEQRNKRTRGYSMTVTVFNTDVRLSRWLQDTFGGRIWIRRNSRAKKILWSWQLGSCEAATILRGCLPYFIMKRDQAEVAITFQETVGSNAMKVVMRDGRPTRNIPDEVFNTRVELARKLKDVRNSSCTWIQ